VTVNAATERRLLCIKRSSEDNRVSPIEGNSKSLEQENVLYSSSATAMIR